MGLLVGNVQRIGSWLLPVALAAACATPSAEGAYLASLRLDPADAVVACRSAGTLASECLTQVAAGLAEHDDGAAMAICADVDARPWRFECPFLVADAARLVDHRADAACAAAGPYRDHCLAHLAGRRARLGDLPDTIGDEAALSDAIAVIVDQLGARAGQRDLTRILVADTISRRWAGGAFDVALCGNADPGLCHQAYRRTVEQSTGGARTGCDAPIHLDLAASLGAAWTPSSVAFASDVWAEHCRAQRLRGHEPTLVPPTPL